MPTMYFDASHQICNVAPGSGHTEYEQFSLRNIVKKGVSEINDIEFIILFLSSATLSFVVVYFYNC